MPDVLMRGVHGELVGEHAQSARCSQCCMGTSIHPIPADKTHYIASRARGLSEGLTTKAVGVARDEPRQQPASMRAWVQPLPAATVSRLACFASLASI